MTDLAVSTICLPEEPLPHILHILENLGVRRLELVALKAERHLDVTATRPSELRQQLEQRGIELAGLYPRPLSMRSEADRASTLDYCCRAVDFALELDCPRLVFSPLICGDKQAFPFGKLIDDLYRLVEYIDDRPINVCLENHHGWPLSTEEDYETVMGGISHPRLAITVDTGHFLASGVDVPAFIKRFGPKIAHLHLKDQQGTTPTRLGEGGVDFPATFQALQEIGYQGIATLELETRGSRSDHQAALEAAVTYCVKTLGLRL